MFFFNAEAQRCLFMFTESIYDTANAVFQKFLAEIQNQSNRFPGNSQISQQLGFKYWMVFAGGFALNDDSIFHQQIDA